MDLPPGFRIPDDASGAEWLNGFDGTGHDRAICEAFPPTFSAFVRVLHPGHRRRGAGQVTWRVAFSARGKGLTANSSWHRDIGNWTDDEFTEPEDNSLPQPEATVVASILMEYTDDPENCWFQWSPVRGLPFEHGTDLVRVRGRLDSWRVRRAGMKRSRQALRLRRSLPSLGGGALVRGPLRSLTARPPRSFPRCGGRRTTHGSSPPASTRSPPTSPAQERVPRRSSATHSLRRSACQARIPSSCDPEGSHRETSPRYPGCG
jgi:hypothetical protein